MCGWGGGRKRLNKASALIRRLTPTIGATMATKLPDKKVRALNSVVAAFVIRY